MPELSLGFVSAGILTRVREALGKANSLREADGVTPRPATAVEVKEWGRDQFKRLVQGTEIRANHEAADAVTIAPVDFTES